MDVGSFIMEANGIRWAIRFRGTGLYFMESKGVDLWNNRGGRTEGWQIFRYNNYYTVP